MRPSPKTVRRLILVAILILWELVSGTKLVPELFLPSFSKTVNSDEPTPVSPWVSVAPSQCSATPLLPTSHTSVALDPYAFQIAAVIGTSAGTDGSATHASPCSRHAKPPLASESPPTAHMSLGDDPQMPNTVLVPGVVMRVNAPLW